MRDVGVTTHDDAVAAPPAEIAHRDEVPRRFHGNRDKIVILGLGCEDAHPAFDSLHNAVNIRSP